MDVVVQILVLAALIEAIVESVEIVKDNPTEWKPYAALVLGGGGAYLFGFDLIGYIGLEPVINGIATAILNPILIGVLILRHSGNINKILEFLKYLKGLGVEAEGWLIGEPDVADTGDVG